MLVLGIETSCDETALALYDSERGLLGNIVSSQVELHAAYGGVVPELASRDHLAKLLPLLDKMLESSQKKLSDVDGIAYTAGPGLAGCLLVGSTFARSLAWGLNIPALAVNHLEGHLFAPFLEDISLQLPFLCLLVSGGHSQFILVNNFGSYVLLGETLDDAVGEAFDKVAKMLGLGYPGGPVIERLAQDGVRGRFTFPRPIINRKGLSLSFSGLKTSVMQAISGSDLTPQLKADVALEFSNAVIETLVKKTMKAIDMTKTCRLVVSGGVSANKDLRKALLKATSDLGVDVLFPSLKFSTDNAAMIAFVGHYRMVNGEKDGKSLNIRPRWPLDEMRAVAR